MKSIFENDAYDSITARLNQLTPTNQALWGKMNTSQMLYHCQMPLNIILEKSDYNLKPNWLVKLLFKKSLYSDKPWRKNLPTAPAFIAKEDKNFDDEKAQLLALIKELYAKKESNEWPVHPAFGTFTKEQWGKMQYKHLDHHFKQFGV